MELALNEVFKPLVEQFEPQIIIRNGGSDPHFSDLLGNLKMTYKGLHNIGKTVREAAKAINSPIINMSCSGYNPQTVAGGWYAILTGLIDKELDIQENIQPEYKEPQIETVKEIIEELAIHLRNYWNL